MSNEYMCVYAVYAVLLCLLLCIIVSIIVYYCVYVHIHEHMNIPECVCGAVVRQSLEPAQRPPLASPPR
jgi:hypothetical protein